MMQFANLILYLYVPDVSFSARAYTPHPSLFFASGARSNFCRAAVTSGIISPSPSLQLPDRKMAEPV